MGYNFFGYGRDDVRTNETTINSHNNNSTDNSDQRKWEGDFHHRSVSVEGTNSK